VFDLYSSANKCLLKVAQFSAQSELFERAAEIYEQVIFGVFFPLTCTLYIYTSADLTDGAGGIVFSG